MFIKNCIVCEKEFSFRSRGKERNEKRKFCSLICCNNFKIGKPQSEETKKKHSESSKGHISWNIGLTAETDNRVRAGKDSPTYGQIPWNKNTHIQTNTGRTHFKKGQIPWTKGVFGIDHPSYKYPEDRVTPLNEQIRHSSLYIEWRDWIFEWDNYTCQKCGERGGVLRAHHIKQFADIMEENNIKSLKEAIMYQELFDVGNGITYCEECHDLLKSKGGLL